MNKGRTPLLVVLLGLAACSTDSTGPGDEVTAVAVLPGSPSVDVGLSVQFTARATNSSGQSVSGLPVRWTSSNTGVATIDDDGLAVGMAVGATAITATIAGVSASEVLSVQPSQCTNRVDVVLSRGEYQAYDADTCLLLPAGSSGDRYRVAVTRPTLFRDSTDVQTVTLEAAPISATAASTIAAAPRDAAAPDPSLDADQGLPAELARIDGRRILEDVELRRRTRRAHQALRERERGLELAFEAALPDLAALAPARTSHPDPAERLELNLLLDCEAAPDPRPVRLVNFNGDIAVYQDSVQWSDPATRLGDTATGQMLAYYASHARGMISDYWGEPSDIDGNGRIIVVAMTDLLNGAAAAVYSGDFLSATGPTCPSSNEAELVYFSQDVIAALDEAEPSYSALSILAHEVKHVVSIYNGLRRGRYHDVWVEEGTAEISQVMSSRIAWAASGGPAIGDVIGGQEIIEYVNANGPGDPGLTPELWGVIGELADLIVNLSTQPNSLIIDPRGAAQYHTFYAASWHFHRFIGDAFGNAATPFGDASLFRALTDSLGLPGTSGLAQQTGRDFDQLFEDVVVATSFHRSTQPPPRDFTTWNLVTATDIFTGPSEVAPPGVYPWPVTGDEDNPNAGFVSGTYEGPMGPSGVRYHDFLSGGTASLQLLVTGAGPTGRIVVSRLR